MIYFMYQLQTMKKTPEEFRSWIEKKIEIEFKEDQENSIEIGQFRRYYD